MCKCTFAGPIHLSFSKRPQELSDDTKGSTSTQNGLAHNVTQHTIIDTSRFQADETMKYKPVPIGL